MPDPRQEFSSRIQFVGFSVLVMAFVIVSRLFQVQIVDHHENVEQLEDKLTSVQYFMSGRGSIISKDGVILAQDAPSYQLQCQLNAITFSDSLGILDEINFYLYPKAKRYAELREEGISPPDKALLLSKIKSCEPRLKREPLLLDLGHQLNLDMDELVSAMLESMENVVKKWAHMSSDQVFDIYLSSTTAQRLLDQPDRFAGFTCIESSIRKYPQGELACHVLGYLGRLSEKNYNILRIKGYYPPDESSFKPIVLSDLEIQNLAWVRNFHVGVSGVEWIFNDRLRGHLHSLTFRRDLERFRQDIPTIDEGDDLHLSIDSRLQKLGQDLLDRRKGSIVMIDIQSGDILASVSFPNFDPNLISPPTEVNFGEYIQSTPGMLINRSISNHYPFGSIYKIITAIASLEEGCVTPESTFFCSHTHGKTKLKCLGYHNDINVTSALEKSCNIYFYECALALGPYKLFNWAKRFGLGEPLGVGFPYEIGGLNPNPLYKQATIGEMWYPGDTCHMAIGQGFQLGTPLQAAMISGIISNDQGCAHPRYWRIKNSLPNIKLDLQPQNRKAVLQGMWEVVNKPKGTAYDSRSNKIIYAGKTGTADVYKMEPHAWFSGFAPFDNPKVALSVLIENGGHGGHESAPIAKEMFEKWQELYMSHK
jgi:penicillin-binding protein 2